MAKKIFLLSLGWLALITGVIGIFLPLLPTTPLVLLASWCFARSSQRFHSWLLNQRHLGPIIQRWENGEGITPTVRNRALIALWLGLLGSMLIVGKWWAPLILGVCGCTGSLFLFKWSKPNAHQAAAPCPLKPQPPLKTPRP
ncbi:YbaN family protein [Halioxenophilus aromaticivorans]|uniref:Inner membrane protein n=1 Tax=Halioxenophilus aromaticivorans TaxID=1306992 RepID=A0AAV3U4W4_9ALTE